MHRLIENFPRPRLAISRLLRPILVGILIVSSVTAQSADRYLAARFEQAADFAKKNAVQQNYAQQLLDISDQVDHLDRLASMGQPIKGVELVMLLNASKSLELANLVLTKKFDDVATELDSNSANALFLKRHFQVVASHEAAHKALLELLNQLEIAAETDVGLESAVGLLADFFAKNPVKVVDFHSSKAPSWESVPLRQDVVQLSELDQPLTLSAVGSMSLNSPNLNDLGETLEVQFTPEIQALAAQLNNDPLEIFQYVRNNIEFTPYRGSRRGAAETLRLNAGNDMDQASLLIALLRTSGFHARYRSATVSLDPTAAMNWLGVEDPDIAGTILTTAGMEGLTINNGEEVSALRCKRVFVEAYLPYTDYRGAAGATGESMWIPLDPAWKSYTNNFGQDMLSKIGFDAESFIDSYVTTVRSETILELLKSSITDWLALNDPESSFEDVSYDRSIDPVQLNWLPASLPYALVSEGAVFDEVPASERYIIRFHIHGEGSTLDYTLNLVEMAGKQVTISYIGATAADQTEIDNNGGILGLPFPYLVNVKPQLRVDGCVVATGTGATMVGRNQNSEIYFTPPGESPEGIFNTILAGNYEGIAVDTGSILPDSDGSPDTNCPEDSTGYYLHQLGVQFLVRAERESNLSASIFGAVTFREVSNAILGQRVRAIYSGGNTLTFDFKGLGVDADRAIISVFYTSGSGDTSEFLRVSGASGSLMENRVFEEEVGVQSVSTIKILAVASDQGIPLFKIDSSNAATLLPQLTQPVATINKIITSINDGKVVTIPRDPLTYLNWSGTGYIDMTPATGAAGYIISGGNSGGDTAEELEELGCTGATVIGVVPLEPGNTYSECDSRKITIVVELSNYNPECEVSISTKEVHFNPKALGAGSHPFNFGGGGDCGGCTPDSITITVLPAPVTIKDSNGRAASGGLLEVVPDLIGESITCTLENATGSPEWTVSGFTSSTLFGKTVDFTAGNWLAPVIFLYDIIPHNYNVVTPACPAPTRVAAYSNKEGKITVGAIDVEPILEVLDAIDGVVQKAGGPFSLDPDFSGNLSFSNQWKEVPASNMVAYTFKFGGEVAGSLSPTFKLGTGLAGFPPVLAEAAVFAKMTGKIGLKGEVELNTSGSLSVVGGSTGEVSVAIGGLVSVASGFVDLTLQGSAAVTADAVFGATAEPPEVFAQTKVVAGTLKVGYKVGAVWGLWSTEETYTVYEGYTVYDRKDVILPW